MTTPSLTRPGTDVATTILATAADLLAEGGLDTLQLREVARRSRMSLSTVYKHFPSRDALRRASHLTPRAVT